MKSKTRILVTGAGGFIGHHLVKRLKADGYWVRGVDIKMPEYEQTAADEFELLDLRLWHNALLATRQIDQVYNLAADMGGIGYITAKLADIAKNNILINAHMLEASRVNGVQRFLFSSSACVYAGYKQDNAEVTPLREEDAHPADPEPGYGWEKLFTEQLCRYYRHDFGFETRIVRFHNVYGPLGTYEGGKEKAPAAISRKVALTPDGDEIEVWGDGQQTRSFMWIGDCVEGLTRLMASAYSAPLNLGTEELVTVDRLVDMVCEIAGSGCTRCTLSNGRKVCADATATTRACGWCWAGSRRLHWRRDWKSLTAGSSRNWSARDDWRQNWCMPEMRRPACRAPMCWAWESMPLTWQRRYGNRSACWRAEQGLRVRDRRSRRDGVAQRSRIASDPEPGIPLRPRRHADGVGGTTARPPRNVARLWAGLHDGDVPAVAATWLPALPVWRSSGSGRTPEDATAGAYAMAENCGYLYTSVRATGRKTREGTRRVGCARYARYFLGGSEHTQAGKIHGAVSRQVGCEAYGRRGSGV